MILFAEAWKWRLQSNAVNLTALGDTFLYLSTQHGWLVVIKLDKQIHIKEQKNNASEWKHTYTHTQIPRPLLYWKQRSERHNTCFVKPKPMRTYTLTDTHGGMHTARTVIRLSFSSLSHGCQLSKCGPGKQNNKWLPWMTMHPVYMH